MTEASDFSNVDRELDATILSFADIQAELNLRHAKDALRDIVENLDLTLQERTGLEPEIGGLEKMLDKLEREDTRTPLKPG